MVVRSRRLASSLSAALSACVSSQVTEIGGGQYMAVVNQSGGIPSEDGLLNGALDLAAERCGDRQHVHVVSVNSGTQSWPNSGNQGRAQVVFECIRPAVVAAVVAASSLPPQPSAAPAVVVQASFADAGAAHSSRAGDGDVMIGKRYHRSFRETEKRK